MKAVLQRVSRAKVTIDGVISGEIGRGILVLLGVGTGDTQNDAEFIVEKTLNLRIFEDDEGKMNRSLLDIAGGILVVSQVYALWRRPKGSSALLRTSRSSGRG